MSFIASSDFSYPYIIILTQMHSGFNEKRKQFPQKLREKMRFYGVIFRNTSISFVQYDEKLYLKHPKN